MKALRIALVIPSAFLFAALVMRALAPHAPARVAVDLVQPLAVATDWHGFGALELGVLLAVMAVAAAAYLRIVASGATAIGLRSPAGVVAIAAISLLCAWCVPTIFSSDVYAYAAYGELSRLGADPYAHATLPAGDAVFDAAVVQWGNPPPACVYGPAFVAIARAVVSIFAPYGIVAQLDGLRALSSVALLVVALLAFAAYPGDRNRRLTASATIALNPAAIWCAAEGHNDALAVAVALGGFALARRGWIGTGAAMAALSGSFKLPGIAAAVPLAIGSRRGAIGTLAGALATLAISAPLLASLAIVVAPHAHIAAQASFQAIVEPLAGFVLPKPWATVVAWALAVGGATALATLATTMLRAERIEGWAFVALAGWLLVPNPYPWYALWLLAVAAAAPATRAATVLIWLSLVSMLRYVPDAVGPPTAAGSVLLGIAATLPFLALLRRRAL